MNDGATLSKETFDKLGSTTEKVRDVRRILEEIGEGMLAEMPESLVDASIAVRASQITPRGESSPRSHMWVMFARDSDEGFPELIHPELLIGKNDGEPFAALRFNAENGRSAEERDRLARRISENTTEFVEHLRQLDGYEIRYKPRHRDKVSKQTQEVTEEEFESIEDSGLTSLLVTRRYRPDEGIFSEEFIEEARQVFHQVFFPLLVEFTYPGREPLGTPSENDETSYFILKTGSDEYADIPSEQYHFKQGIQGSNQIRETERVKFVYLENGQFYAIGEIGDIESEKRDGETHYFAEIIDYEEIDPVNLEDVRDHITPSFPKQYGIIKITERDYGFLTGNRDPVGGDQTGPKSWELGDVDRVAPRFDLDPAGIELENLHFDDEERLLGEILSSLRQGNHLLFVGPPGTGKSKLARRLADELVGDEYEMTAATADWSTFDTIGGYRQQRNGKLSFSPGLFLSRFQDDSGRPTNEWLIVDEFNRANIDQAFGPLFSVLAGDDVVLPFTDGEDRDVVVYGSELDESTTIRPNEYVVPSDWRLFATMNTFDKSSLYDLSYALSRRFGYIHVPAPSVSDIEPDLVEAYVECWDDFDPSDSEIDDIVVLWRAVQRERPLGPAIIRDVLEAADIDFTTGVTQHVLPQFEGLMNNTQKNLLEELAETGLVNEAVIERFGQQYFELHDWEL